MPIQFNKLAIPRKLAIFLIVILVVFPLFFILILQTDERLSLFLKTLQDNRAWYSIVSFLMMCSDILLPIPSSMIMWMNGAVLGLCGGFILSFCSSSIAGILGYYLGSKGFKDISAHNLKAIKKISVLLIIGSRGIPIVSETISILSGFYNIGYRPFVIYNSLGYLPVCFIYTWLGRIDQDSGEFFIGFIISLLLSLLIWLLSKVIRFSDESNRLDH